LSWPSWQLDSLAHGTGSQAWHHLTSTRHPLHSVLRLHPHRQHPAACPLHPTLHRVISCPGSHLTHACPASRHSRSHTAHNTSFLATPMMKAAPALRTINTKAMKWSRMWSWRTSVEMEWSWTLCWVHMARIMMDTQMADQCGSLRMVPSPRQHRHHPPCLQGPLPHLHLPRSPPHHGHQHPLHQLFSTPWMRYTPHPRGLLPRSRMCETSRSWISSGCSPTWRTGRTCGMA
jgi:hypothetical protein